MKRKSLQGAMFYGDNGYSYIPTYGLPCSAMDLFRLHHFEVNDFLDSNPGFSSYIDYNNIAIFENEITSLNQILKFESALRFILLTDKIKFLHPSVKYLNKDTGLQSYLRIKNFSKDSANLVYSSIGAFDSLFPAEKLIIENNIVQSSTDENSEFIGDDFTTLNEKLINNNKIDSILHSIPSQISAPFTSSNTETSEHNSIIIQEYLKSLDNNFSKNTKFSIKSGYNIPLPFFTNSILSIAKNRDDIPNAIIKLRDELYGLRKQLFDYQIKLKGIESIKDQSILQSDILNAINTYTNGIYRSDTLVTDTIRLIVEFIKNPSDILIKPINPNYNLENEFPILFGNSNFKRLRNQISKDNINTNIFNFLTEKEIKNISA